MGKEIVPTYDAFMNPLLQAMKSLGGSGTIEEIEAKVLEIAGLSEDQVAVLHNPEKGGLTEVGYRLAWTRTYLRKAGLLENSSRGVWALTPRGMKLDRVDEKEIVRTVKVGLKDDEDLSHAADGGANDSTTWKEELITALRNMKPDAFERLVQRILRESGFIQVQVTGRSGDGGIDGRGILRISGLLSFHVIFQCKRWQGSVSSAQVRDFRGAMVGRADKGLLITTGTFTQDAVKEATRDGAPAIDLIDSDHLMEKLKELGLGVSTRTIEVEEVQVDPEWFANV
jgi:restriction system protein